jgi:hypothetical protein
MNITIIFIGIVLIGLFILPFVLFGVGKNKDQKALTKHLLKLAEDQNCTIHNIELFSDSAVGIDEAEKNVFFVSRFNSILCSEHIRLAEVKSCSIRNQSRHIKTIDGSRSVVDKLELVFIKKEKSSSEIVLVLFNAEGSKLYTDELILVEKWCKIISSKLD